MDKINFFSHKDLANYMHEKAFEGKTATAVLLYDDAKILIKELLKFNNTSLDNVEISNPMLKGYDKEFYITLDDDFGIWSEEAYHEVDETGFKGYYKFGDENAIALICSDANSQVIKAAKDSNYIAEIEINDDCYYKCDDDCYLKNIITFIFDYILEQ